MYRLIFAAMLIPVFIQGGFFIRTTALSGILLSVALAHDVFRRGIRRDGSWRFLHAPAVCLSLMAVCYAISAVCHQSGREAWERCIYILVTLAGVLCVGGVEQTEREKLFRWLVYAGAAEALAGMYCYAGLPFVLRSVIVNARFMGTFQYANATALFLGIALIVQKYLELMGRRCGSRVRFMMMVMLVLTFSAGGLFCYAGAVVFIDRNMRRGSVRGLLDDLLELALAGVMALAVYWVKFRLGGGGPAVAVLFAVIGVVSYRYGRPERGRTVNSTANVALAAALFPIPVLAAGFMLFGKRIGGTGGERLLQMRDGILALLQQPFTGLGTGAWKDYIAGRLDIVYEVSLIHNSYIQIGVEAGVAAVILWAVFLGCLWRRTYRDGMYGVLGRAVLLMAGFHWFFDITWFFWGIIICVVVCSAGEDPR